jgi:hypothetical protein
MHKHDALVFLLRRVDAVLGTNEDLKAGAITESEGEKQSNFYNTHSNMVSCFFKVKCDLSFLGQASDLEFLVNQTYTEHSGNCEWEASIGSLGIYRAEFMPYEYPVHVLKKWTLRNCLAVDSMIKKLIFVVSDQDSVTIATFTPIRP